MTFTITRISRQIIIVETIFTNIKGFLSTVKGNKIYKPINPIVNRLSFFLIGSQQNSFSFKIQDLKSPNYKR